MMKLNLGKVTCFAWVTHLVVKPKIASLVPVAFCSPYSTSIGEIDYVIFILMKKNHLGGINI